MESRAGFDGEKATAAARDERRRRAGGRTSNECGGGTSEEGHGERALHAQDSVPISPRAIGKAWLRESAGDTAEWQKRAVSDGHRGTRGKAIVERSHAEDEPCELI